MSVPTVTETIEITTTGYVKEPHPAAQLFPEMIGSDFDELVSDIREHGLREPIVLHPDGSILDGRNRYRACLAAGVLPAFETWDGRGSAVAYVVSLNLRRRHLDESQRALVAARIATLGDGQRQVGKFADVPTQAEAAQMLNVSERSVRTGREVLLRGAPGLVTAVEQGKASVSAAADVATLPEPEQQEIVARGEREIVIKAREIRRRWKAEKDPWQMHWKGMPEFVQGDFSPWKTIRVHFASLADMEAFAELVGQRLTIKTRSIWYPKAEIAHMVGRRYSSRKAEEESAPPPCPRSAPSAGELAGALRCSIGELRASVREDGS